MKTLNLVKVNAKTSKLVLLFLYLLLPCLTQAQTFTCNAHFIHQSASGAAGVYFSPNSNPSGATYHWAFGDGGTSILSNPVHTYAPGNYQACLTVTVAAGPNTLACTATFCDSIHISNTTVTCNAHFTMQPGSAINSIQFINSVNPTGATYLWSFGDGGSSTNADPNHVFANGNYQVCLTVTVPGANGTIACTTTHCDSVHFNPITVNCNAHYTHQFSPSNASGIYFMGQPNATGATYLWHYGDGTSGTGMNSYHLYAAGNYQACLTVTIPASSNSTGCTSTFCDSIHIAPTTVTCNAVFTHHHSTTNGLAEYFFGSTNNPTGTIYNWTFGDGATGTGINPDHAYAPGNYLACLTVTVPGLNGVVLCTATYCDSVHIAPTTVTCSAVFTHHHSSTNSLVENFTGTANPAGTIYSWTFGDGTNGTGINPVHTYVPGHYKTCLTVTVPGLNGAVLCTATYCDSVHIATVNVNCNAHFTIQQGTAFNSYYFVSSPNPGGTKYLWTFGDGSSATTVNASHNYAPGHYKVCLKVTVLAIGSTVPLCTATYCDSIHVANMANCLADFSYMKVANAVRTYSFTNLSSASASSYFWHFGDASTSTLANPVHQYATVGQRQVCLTIFDIAHQCSNTKCKTISVTTANASNVSKEDNVSGDMKEVSDALLVTVFPNPTTNNAVIHIENAQSPVTFMMYDSTGKLSEKRVQLNNGDYEINNGDRAAGIYYYRVISDENSAVSGKLILQK